MIFMQGIPSLFEQFLFTEAPGDPPDMGPPDMPADAGAQMGPPDMPDISETQPSIEGDMPDMGGMDLMGPMDGGGGDLGGSDFSADAAGDDQNGDQQEEEPMQLDDKVDAIMNQQLYQRFLALLNSITSQVTMMKNNSDILYTLSPDSLENIDSLKKLEENVRLYLKNTFIRESYSKNLLFFNKCLNLLKLLNSVFDDNIRKGIKDAE